MVVIPLCKVKRKRSSRHLNRKTRNEKSKKEHGKNRIDNNGHFTNEPSKNIKGKPTNRYAIIPISFHDLFPLLLFFFTFYTLFFDQE